MFWSRVGIVLIASVMLGGCATKDCDPNSGGFIGGVACMNSGGYDSRINERERQLLELKAQEQQTAIHQTELKTKKADLRTQFEEISNDVDNLAVKVNMIKSTDVLTRQKAARLTKKIKKIQFQLTNLKQQSAKKQTKEADLKKRSAELEQEVADLWEIYNSL